MDHIGYALNAEEGMTKHTPGPWTVESTGMGYSVRGDGNGHCVVFTNTASCSKAALRRSISKDEEESANARLVAAAPDLLEALERITRELGVPQPGYPQPVANAVEIARAAIAKARGDV